MPPLCAADIWKAAAVMAENFAAIAEGPFARHRDTRARDEAIAGARALRAFATALRRQAEDDMRTFGQDVTPVRRTIVTPDAFPEMKRRKTPALPPPPPPPPKARR